MSAQKLAYWVVRALRRAVRMVESLGSVQAVAIEKGMSRHDMASDPDEHYYLEQYWYWLLPECERHFPGHSGRVLDIGCGRGRLALRVAAWLTNGTVVGVDLLRAAVQQARYYAQERGLTNVEFHQGDAVDFVSSLPADSFDLVLMTEATFFMPSYRDVIDAVARVLKSGGVFFVSFRSQYYDLLYSIHERNWQAAFQVRDEREGHWGGGTTWFSWHTTAEIRQLLGEAGLTVLRLCGVGIASGIEGDPLATIAQPSKLSQKEKAQLMQLETSLAECYADCGRYILAIAVRTS